MSWTPGGPPPREVCIVMLSAIGDAVHVLPVATALKRAWPETRITWIIQPVPHQLVRGHRAVDEFIVFHRRRGLQALRSYRELGRTLGGRRFDLLLGLQVYFKAGLITALVDADVKLGFDRARARDLQWLFTNRRIPATGQHHVQDQYFEFLRYLGVDPEPVRWDLEFAPEERAAQRAFFAPRTRPVLAVVVATSKEEKNWRVEGYARVLDEAYARYGLDPVIVGGPAPLERRIAEAVAGQTRAPVALEMGDDLRRLAWILDGSALVLSPDTGPLHLAHALDAPVVGLYGYTNPKRAGPYRRFRDLVVDGYARHPGEDYPITPAYRDGMKRITAEMVLDRMERAAERYLPERLETLRARGLL